MTRPKRWLIVTSQRWRLVGDSPEIESLQLHARVHLEDPVFSDEFKQRDYEVKVDELRETVNAATDPDALQRPLKRVVDEARAILVFIEDLQDKLQAVMRRAEAMPDGS